MCKRRDRVCNAQRPFTLIASSFSKYSTIYSSTHSSASNIPARTSVVSPGWIYFWYWHCSSVDPPMAGIYINSGLYEMPLQLRQFTYRWRYRALENAQSAGNLLWSEGNDFYKLPNMLILTTTANMSSPTYYCKLWIGWYFAHCGRIILKYMKSVWVGQIGAEAALPLCPCRSAHASAGYFHFTHPHELTWCLQDRLQWIHNTANLCKPKHWFV